MLSNAFHVLLTVAIVLYIYFSRSVPRCPLYKPDRLFTHLGTLVEKVTFTMEWVGFVKLVRTIDNEARKCRYLRVTCCFDLAQLLYGADLSQLPFFYSTSTNYKRPYVG